MGIAQIAGLTLSLLSLILSGKLGSPAHQARIQEIADDIAARGMIPKKEFRIDTPGGAKSRLYADVVGLDSNGNLIEIYQIGKTTKTGIPVSRERQALDDIYNATGINSGFHSY